MSRDYKEIPLLAHTHGQPASPTSLGKEMKVYEYRLGLQLDKLKKFEHSAKFGGATGNFNAHMVSYPSYDWPNEINKMHILPRLIIMMDLQRCSRYFLGSIQST